VDSYSRKMPPLRDRGATGRRAPWAVARCLALALALVGPAACIEADTVARSIMSRACAAQPPHSTGGTEVSSNGGQSWSACQGFTCLDQYELVSGACAPRSIMSRACAAQPPHSTGGTEVSSDGGQSWSACQGFTCLEHYELVSGACAPRSYTLTVLAPTHGALSGAASGATYPYGSTVNLTAILPDATYGVRGWTGDAAPCGIASSCQIAMDADKAVGAEIGKVPVGFGRAVTGGQGGAVVEVSTAAELAAALCGSVASGVCTDATPRIIRLSSVIDFRNTEGTATSQGCVYAVNDCTLNGRTEKILNKGSFCTGKTLSSITYDAAGTNPMLVGSNKTVIGVGANAGWKGKGLLLKDGNSNIIIRNLSITDVNEGIIWAGDGIALDGVSGVWIDHNYLARFGRMMIVSGWGTAANVTISNNVFDGATFCGHYCDGRHYWNVLMTGADQSITFVGNRLQKISGDAPELGKPSSAPSGGAVHLLNNYYVDVNKKAIVPASGILALVEGNFFSDAPDYAPILQLSGSPVFAPLEADIATANVDCQTTLGRNCSGNRATNSTGNFVMDAAVMPAIRATPAYAIGMGGVTPLSSAQVPASVGAAAGPQDDPDR
jgi:pectate lyase